MLKTSLRLPKGDGGAAAKRDAGDASVSGGGAFGSQMALAQHGVSGDPHAALPPGFGVSEAALTELLTSHFARHHPDNEVHALSDTTDTFPEKICARSDAMAAFTEADVCMSLCMLGRFGLAGPIGNFGACLYGHT